MGVYGLQSDSVQANPGEIRLRATGALGCDRDEEGRYAFDRSRDGMFLTLTLVDDACALRSSVLARTWVRAHGPVNDGRRGVLDAFSPEIVVDLPEGRWSTPAELLLNGPEASTSASLAARGSSW